MCVWVCRVMIPFRLVSDISPSRHLNCSRSAMVHPHGRGGKRHTSKMEPRALGQVRKSRNEAMSGIHFDRVMMKLVWFKLKWSIRKTSWQHCKARSYIQMRFMCARTNSNLARIWSNATLTVLTGSWLLSTYVWSHGYWRGMAYLFMLMSIVRSKYIDPSIHK